MPAIFGRIIARSFATVILIFAAVPANAQPLGQRAPMWDRALAEELLSYVNAAQADGLSPADYQPDRLTAAIAANDPAALDDAATRSFALLARDLINGHVRPEQRKGWFYASREPEQPRIEALMEGALASRRITGTLDRLLPGDPQYYMLRLALASTPEDQVEQRMAIRVNMERWRWMPRDNASSYLFVNIPAFTVSVIDQGFLTAQHRVITGKPSTPTPQFSATVNGVILNPNWYVPQSIIAESVGALVRNNPAEAKRRGYEATRDARGALHVRQLPGEKNALGLMKLVMPNPLSVYLHDTPSKALFDRDVRAFSHGCIRTDDALGFAETLLSGTPGWDRASIDAAIVAGKTVQVDLGKPMPVYVGYFTLWAATDGTLTSYPDVYKLDEAIAAALN